MKKLILSTMVVSLTLGLFVLFFPTANLHSHSTHSGELQVVEGRVKTCPNAGCTCTMIDDGKGNYYCPCCGYRS